MYEPDRKPSWQDRHEEVTGGASPALATPGGSVTDPTVSELDGADARLPGGWGEYGVGEVMGQRYRVLAVRRGGMGLVYIVEDLPSREQNIRLRLALKTFQDRYLWDSQAITRFEREALTWIELGLHPHIVHALIVQEIEGKPYIWLEYVEGESLAERLALGPLDVTQALDFSMHFASGMRYAHEKHGLLHRDIKPGNMLVSREGILKITDFGLAKIQAELAEQAGQPGHRIQPPDSEQTQSRAFATGLGVLIGTPAYMPPEAILNPSQVDVRGDIYSFGLVLYEMLTGRRVFHGPNVLEEHLHARPTPLRAVRPGVPAALEALVSKCLEKDRERRFGSFAELESALADAARGLPEEFQRAHASTKAVPDKGRWFMKAHTLMEFGRLKEALDCYAEALKLDPSEAEVYNNMAVCLTRLGRIEEAVSYAEKAVALRSTYAEAWANLGGLYAALGDYERGLAACERALALKPDWAEGHANRGINLVGLERYEEAGACFERARKADPNYWRAYLMAAEAAARQGAPPNEILPLLDKALTIKPREASTLAFMAACLDDLGRTEEARRHLALAREVNPNDRLFQKIQQVFEHKYK